jgi:hypothetical protein
MASIQNNAVSNHKQPDDDGSFGTDGGIPSGALGIAPLKFLASPDTGRGEFSGRPDNFQGNQIGRFPRGWQDVALTDPTGEAVSPSAQVIETTDAFGHQTKAVQFQPQIGIDKGIYRAIEPDGHYSIRADVRIDQFSDYDPSEYVEDPNNPGFYPCGCPVGSELEFPVQIGFAKTMTDGSPLHLWPQMGIYAGAISKEWKVFDWTANTYTDHTLGLPVVLGKWYGIEFDVDAPDATMRSLITDRASGDVLVDRTEDLTQFGNWDPTIDGSFDLEALFGGELTAKLQPNIFAMDNIDVPVGSRPSSFDNHGHLAIGSTWAGDN